MVRIKHRKLPSKVPAFIKEKRLKVCNSGKKVFYTKTDANIFLARIQLREKNNRYSSYHKTPVRSYRCNYCGYYHVTSQRQVERLNLERLN